MLVLSQIVLFLSCCLTLTSAKRSLSASSLVPCMENSSLTATTFEVSFNPESRTLSYNLDLNTTINGYVNAKVDVYAYGFKIISEKIDLCDLSFKQFCPLYSGEVIVDSVETIDEKYVDMIPNIAYTVPDIDAYVKIMVYDSNSTSLACMAAYFTNGKTVAHTGAKWATAVVAGLGLFASAFLSTFGNSNAASHISVNALSLFTYFQSVVLVAMEHVESVPPIASAWAENLSWSMGLIRVEFMQEIFRWYIQATGGTPTLYLKGAASEKAIFVQKRIVDYLRKRAPALVVNSSDSLRVLRGIKRMGYDQAIEVTSIVVTGFTFFMLCGYVLCLLILFVKFFIEFLVKVKVIKNPSTAIYFRTNYRSILKGALLRYISIGFVQLTVFSLWEFTIHDSAAVIVLAILFLVLVVGILGWATYRTWVFGKTSVEHYKNPAAILYGNQLVLDKYGFAYTMFNANKYWWGAIFMSYCLIKAIFIGLCQSSGKTQALVIWLLDSAYLTGLIIYKPYLDKSTNVLNIVISSVTVANSFMFVFFSNLFQQPAAVSSIMGWIFFILNAAFSLVLLVVVIVYIAMALLSKVPDSRFRRAGDDRTSFQRNSAMFADEKSLQDSMNGLNSDFIGSPNPGAEELLDLGKVAKNHQNNWENEIYKLKDMVSSQGDLIEETTNEALQLRSKSTIEQLRNVNSNQPSYNDNDKIGLEDDEPIQIVKPTFGSKLSNTLFKRQNSAGASYGNSTGGGLNSLTRKLSAIKMSRNNSQLLKRQVSMNDHSALGANGAPVSGNYTSIPMNSAPNSPDPSALMSPGRNPSYHGRTLSQTPMTSSNDEEFNFDSTPSGGDVNLNYSGYNSSQPMTGIDVTMGGQNHAPARVSNSPVLHDTSGVSEADNSSGRLMGGRYASNLGQQ
ncbi:flavin adenine dinucleotide transporter [Saccharomycopsis crataegensis]|uniref:Flavin adenine dinucleotide transporter n=1 Tax=Saccharomycopsis crataegensis TaxID=43959 RepID=A0AAV5QR75_9ASCO|nr:flavin adenine dinucleotide transporter [Saccharomycopsis crataegensis]